MTEKSSIEILRKWKYSQKDVKPTTMHYGKVVMGRRTFKYTAIQRKISLSLSNWLRCASKSLCKSKENEQNSYFSDFAIRGCLRKNAEGKYCCIYQDKFWGTYLDLRKHPLHPFRLFLLIFSLLDTTFVLFLFTFRLWGNKKASNKIFHMLDENLAEKWLSKVGYFVTALKHECPQLWHSAMTHWQVKLCCKMIWFTWKPATQVKVAEVWIALQPHLLKAPEFDANY